MMRQRRRPYLLSLVLLGSLLLPAAVWAAQVTAHSFKVTIQSKLQVESDGQKQQLDADTTLKYTWRHKGSERELMLDGLDVKVMNNGAPMVDTKMNRDKLVASADGKTQELPFDQAPAPVKSLLQDAFRSPLYRYQVDGTGNRVLPVVMAGPGAKSVVQNGMIANALLFHPPFANQDAWESDAEFSMGNGGYAKGKLVYRRIADGKFDVSGTLTNPGYTQADTAVTVKDARYVVTGEETFDPQQQDWANGKLSMDVSFRMFLNDKSIGNTAGKMNVSFERLPDPR